MSANDARWISPPRTAVAFPAFASGAVVGSLHASRNSASPSPSSVFFRIERIAQSLSEQVEPEHAEQNSERGRREEPRRGQVHVLTFVEHVAPRRRGRRDA